MDKFLKQIEESATINELLKIVNKREERKKLDYLKYYIPFMICSIALYTAVILFIVFVFKQYIIQFVSTFSVIFILFTWGVFDKYFSLKIFRFIRQKEFEHFSNKTE